jgi:hypothetical protein
MEYNQNSRVNELLGVCKKQIQVAGNSKRGKSDKENNTWETERNLKKGILKAFPSIS